MCIPLACNKYIVYAYMHFMGKQSVWDQDTSLDAAASLCSCGVQRGCYHGLPWKKHWASFCCFS